MKILMRMLAPFMFWLAYGLFRAGPGKGSLKKHNFVMRLFRFAADNHNRQALSMYGHLLHFRGEGVQNRIQGAIYLERAAGMGDIKACYQMGRIFENGFEHYYRPDPERALGWYRQAAEQGHPLAVRRLHDVYREGQLGQSVDEAQAQRWYRQLP
ncbi:MAG: sel1 repeat family protein [Marinobacterium sp.]|nr:sel1 repeat family protein [Marinobacterium sp.]